ncbi:MAG TPA: SDR family oxidoreductase [Rubrobacteraceae bacterium]|jgi:NAD(P)-dependent dehydrogenase (short-subunit alcohol dehydrogenase family)
MPPNTTTFDLSSQVALVTGAGSGLGAATARLLAEHGARVVLADINKEATDEVAAAFEGQPLYMDLTDSGSIEGGIADVLDAESKIDVLVNAAGLDFIRSAPELTLEEWDKVVNVNLRAPWLLAKLVMPHMIERGSGQILNVASTAAKKGWENAAAYVSSKHGLLGLTQVLHAEGRRHGVRAMAVVPGGMRTNFFAALDPPPPPENLQPPETVARSILFMISQPLDSVIHELIVTPMTETSYP